MVWCFIRRDWYPLKVDADASVVDNVPVHVALRPEKIMLAEEPPANGCNFAWGGDTHCLSRRSFGLLSTFRLKSGQMISAQLQNAHRHIVKGYRPGGPKCVCAGRK